MKVFRGGRRSSDWEGVCVGRRVSELELQLEYVVWRRCSVYMWSKVGWRGV